jgi:hypothetical protein
VRRTRTDVRLTRICAHVEPVGTIETEHERPWATVLRVPLADGVAEVLGHDEERAWLLLGDAGTPIGAFGNPPEAWLVALPLYAQLQRGEATHFHDHLAHGVPHLRVATLPARYDEPSAP